MIPKAWRLLREFEASDATIPVEKRSTGVEDLMQRNRRLESPDERSQRLDREAQNKRDESVANEAAIDRMIRRNIEQYGP
ncbi:MAG TPA: hypothetical protein VHS33_00130 [Sphingomicrobium sp.]|jgi:hypothetical protein|nr:hypothetical protein [Sphingomicrobium sp.]